MQNVSYRKVPIRLRWSANFLSHVPISFFLHIAHICISSDFGTYHKITYVFKMYTQLTSVARGSVALDSIDRAFTCIYMYFYCLCKKRKL